MKKMITWSSTLAGWLITLMVPPMLLVTSILMLLNPVFLNLEYRRPGFPADPSGFHTRRAVEVRPRVGRLPGQPAGDRLPGRSAIIRWNPLYIMKEN